MGYRNICDIKIGDLVLTHKGRFKRVVAAKSRLVPEYYKVKTFLNRNFTCLTGEHPILTDDNSWNEIKNININDFICSSPKIIEGFDSKKTFDLFETIKPNFFKLKTLDNDNKLIYLNDRRHKTIHKRFIDVDYDLGYIIGFFLAEGHYQKNSIAYSFNYEKELHTIVKKICDIYENKFGIKTISLWKKRHTKCGQLYINSAIVRKFIKMFVDGNDCYTKGLSEFAYSNGNKEFFRGVLDGTFDGDGCTLEQYNKVISITSNKLIYDLKYILQLLGYGYFSNGSQKEDFSIESEILGRKVNLCRQYKLCMLQTRNKKIEKISEFLEKSPVASIEKRIDNYKNIYSENKQYYINKIKSIEHKHEELQVYNIQVEEDESFVTEHFVAHNCAFNSSGDTFIYHEDITKLERTCVDPIEIYPYERNVWIWEKPQKNGTYIIAADISRGDAEDYSAFHVLRLDVHPLVQVAEFKGKIRPDQLGILLMNISQLYNNATIAPENNSGWSGQTILKIEEAKFPFLYYSRKRKPKEKDFSPVDPYYAMYRNDFLPGYAVTALNRLPMLAKLEQYIRLRRSKIIFKKNNSRI